MTRQILATFPHGCNQRVRRIGEKNGKPFNNFSKTNKKTKKTTKKHIKSSSFITRFKIEFLLPFAGHRKVLGEMPDKY